MLVLIPGVAALLLAAPGEYLGVVLMGLYTVPSHSFVSPFAHEPVLLYFARDHGAWALAAASTWGALVAALIDYRFARPLLHHPRVRPRYENAKLYRRSIHWFGKAPFFTLVVAGFTPIPFYPFKFLALAGHYPLGRYMLALAVGRTPRYGSLAYLGYVLQPPTWVLAVFMAVLLGLAVRQIARERSRSIAEERTPHIEAPPVAEGESVD